MEWIVRFEFEAPPGRDADVREDLLDVVLEVLAGEGRSPSATHDASTISVRVSIECDDGVDAAGIAKEAISRAWTKAWEQLGLDVFGGYVQTVRLEAETAVAFNVALEFPDGSADLLGVTELAELLGVSRQRASELAHTEGFPSPLVTLAAGPVWRLSSVARYAGQWRRRPGRPRKPYHVYPVEKGWEIRREGARDPEGNAPSREGAVKAAMMMARGMGARLVVHGRDGRIVAEENYEPRDDPVAEKEAAMPSSKDPVYDVSPDKGDWTGTKRGASRASVRGDTKREVVERTRAMAKEQKGRLVIRRQDGTIQEERTYTGHDPHPPKG